MVIVITLVGVLMSIAIPYFRGATLRSSVRGAMDAIASMHSLARATAIQRGRTSRLVMVPASSRVYVIANRATGGAVVDTVGSVENLGERFGVSLTTTRDTLVFTPRGIGAELTGTTVIVSKGDFRDTLVISAAGRITP